MKILLVFIDMLRVDHLSLYNEKAAKSTLDCFFGDLGGTVLTNCYTPAPDTPRSIACMQTGLLPHFNGCDTRIKWPRYFIFPNVSTIFDFAVNKEYTVNLCATKIDIDTGLFKIQESDKINFYTDIDSFVGNSPLSLNTLSLIALNDYHSSIDDYGCTEMGVSKGQKIVRSFFDRYITKSYINQYDYTFFFSDHGHAIDRELIKQKSRLELLNNGRTQLTMFYHRPDDKNIVIDNRLASMVDLYASLIDLMGGKEYRQGYSFFKEAQRDMVHIEDHSNFKVSPEQIINQWRVITDLLDIRTNGKETIDSSGREVDLNLISTILSVNSPWFDEYVKQIKILDMYADMKEYRPYYFTGAKRLSSLKRIMHRILIKVRSLILRYL